MRIGLVQGESLRAVSEALRKLRPREEEQEPPSATSGGTSQASAGTHKTRLLMAWWRASAWAQSCAFV